MKYPAASPRDLLGSSTKVVKEWASDKQAWLYHRGPYPTLLVGGQNSGKTVGCVLKGLTLLQTYPGSRLAIIRRSNIQLQKTTMESWFQFCAPAFYRPYGGFNQNSGVLDFNNGSRVYFLHLDQPDSLDVLAGLELNFAYVSQVEEISEKAWDLLDVRCGRWTGATIPEEILDAYPGGRDAWPWRSEDDPSIRVPPRYIFAEGYVTDETHWLYQRFADESPFRAKWKAQGYACKIVESRDNRFAIKAVVEALYSKDEDYIRRYVKPRWGNPEGAIFNVSPLSLLQPTPALLDRIRTTMRWHRALDHGDSAPSCCVWYAIDHDGNIFVVREHYKENLLVTQHRKAIFELGKDDPPYQTNYADPSIFGKSRGRSADRAPEWCLAPETRVLTADLRHVRADSLRIGDHVAGFDEGDPRESFAGHVPQTQPQRMWRRACVTAAAPVQLPTYRLTLDDDTVIECSAEHLWLTNPTGGWRIWRRTKKLKVGQRLLRAVSVWDVDTSWGAGYLAAAFDGEGFLTLWRKGTGSSFRVGFCQRPNAMLGQVEHELVLRRFQPSWSRGQTSQSKLGRPVDQFTIGGRAEIMRLLGSVRPQRLLSKFDLELLGRVHVISKPAITKIENLGMRTVIALGTSTRTLIAEGLMSHNSIADEWRDGRIGDPRTTISWTRSQNDESTTISRMKEFLFVDPNHRHPITGELGAPHIYFIVATPDYPNGCYEVLKDLRAQRRKSVAIVGDVKVFTDERDDTVRDHGYDALKYGVVMRPSPASPGAPPPTPPGQIALATYEEAGREARRNRARAARASGTGLKYGF